MQTIDRYIRMHLLRGFIIVSLILWSVFSFLDFVEELDDTALGNYSVFDASVFVLMTLPERALWLVPICALLGTLVGMSLLEGSNELTVMRTSGVSAKRIVWSAIKASLVLVAVVCLVGEIVGPRLGEQAWRARALAIAGDIILRKESGTNYWFRDGQRFIGIRDMVYGQIPTGVEIYEFGDAAQLDQYTYAREAQRDGDGSWRLIDVVRKRFEGMKIHVEPLDSLSWQGFLSPKHGALIELEAESLSPSDLYQYTRDLRARGQNADRYELAFWRKISIPLATVAMVLVALPFVFGHIGRGGIGRRVLLGAAVGVAFYLLDQVVAQIGLLLNLNPMLTATAPSIALFAIGLACLPRLK